VHEDAAVDGKREAEAERAVDGDHVLVEVHPPATTEDAVGSSSFSPPTIATATPSLLLLLLLDNEAAQTLEAGGGATDPTLAPPGTVRREMLEAEVRRRAMVGDRIGR